ncbi:MAG: preprotein translocase subunit YajC [Actinomycetota bacterium]|nr:preprotein translocase subunit YajC [Actinomycetota bacterium]
MHPALLAALLVRVVAAAKTAKTTKASGAGGSFFLIVIVALAILYFFVLRPRSRRARQSQGGRKNLEVGDDVVTAGGILGRITAIEGDEVEVEVAPGSTLTFWRRAVNLRSSVAGAPPPRTAEESDGRSEPPEPWSGPDAHYGVEDRFDDGEEHGGSEPSGHFGRAGDDGSDDEVGDEGYDDDGGGDDGGDGYDDGDYEDDGEEVYGVEGDGQGYDAVEVDGEGAPASGAAGTYGGGERDPEATEGN